MITRIWRGWTTRENATAYQRLLLDEIFPGIAVPTAPLAGGVQDCHIHEGRRGMGDGRLPSHGLHVDYPLQSRVFARRGA
jgi:hypothetical protein